MTKSSRIRNAAEEPCSTSTSSRKSTASRRVLSCFNSSGLPYTCRCSSTSGIAESTPHSRSPSPAQPIGASKLENLLQRKRTRRTLKRRLRRLPMQGGSIYRKPGGSITRNRAVHATTDRACRGVAGTDQIRAVCSMRDPGECAHSNPR